MKKLIITIAVLAMAACAFGGAVSFPSLAPQTEDAPYELTQKQTAALAAIASGTSKVLVSGTANVALSGIQRSVTTSAVTTSGTLAAGVRSVTFVASSTASVAVGALPLVNGASLTIPAPTGDSLGSIPYTVTSGTLYLVEIR